MKNDICWCKIEHKTARNKQSGGCILQTIIRSTFKTSSTMGYSRKEKHTENCAKLCYISWKLQDQKPRPLETPHFFFVTPGNSTCYFCDSDIPGNSMSSTTTLFYFFPGIDQCKEGVCVCAFFFFHLILVGISSILICFVKNRGGGMLNPLNASVALI